MGFVDDEHSSEAGSVITTPNTDEEAALLGKISPYLSDQPYTPTTKNNDLHRFAKLRSKGKAESEEIWEELEDDRLSSLPSPFFTSQHRRSSARSTSNTSSGRVSRVLFDPQDDTAPTDSTALLARSGTGRSYRDHRRRRSAPGLEAQGRERRKPSGGSQEALGGWWKMKWWTGLKEVKGKAKQVDSHGGDDGAATNERPSSA